MATRLFLIAILSFAACSVPAEVRAPSACCVALQCNERPPGLPFPPPRFPALPNYSEGETSSITFCIIISTSPPWTAPPPPSFRLRPSYTQAVDVPSTVVARRLMSASWRLGRKMLQHHHMIEPL